VADVGCGNGKYLGINRHIYAVSLCCICLQLRCAIVKYSSIKNYVTPTTSLTHLSVCTGCASQSASHIKSPWWSIEFSKELQCIIWVHSFVCLSYQVSVQISALLALPIWSTRRAVPSWTIDNLNGNIPFQLSTIGNRTFKGAAAQTWDGLPVDVTSSPTLSVFHIRKHICFVDLILKLLRSLICLPHSGLEVTKRNED